jgi:hypothetical protein
MAIGVKRRTVVAFAAASALGALVVALLAGPLEDSRASDARIRQRLMAVDPPQLWRAAALGAQGQASAATFICADTPLAKTFGRGLPEVNGETCRVTAPPSTGPNRFAAKCEALGRRFAVSTATHGDLTRDFQLDFALATLEPPLLTVRQSIRYVRLGPCPAGWGIGDQARSPAAR